VAVILAVSISLGVALADGPPPVLTCPGVGVEDADSTFEIPVASVDEAYFGDGNREIDLCVGGGDGEGIVTAAEGVGERLILQGSSFVQVNGEVPTVEIDGEEYGPVTLSNCKDVAVEEDEDDDTPAVQSCETLTVTLPDNFVVPSPSDDALSVVVIPPAALPSKCAPGPILVTSCQSCTTLGVLAVDPPVIFPPTLLPVTLFLSGLDISPLSSYSFVNVDTGELIDWDLVGEDDEGSDEGRLVVLPSANMTSGVYTVGDATGCASNGTAGGAVLTVVAEPDIEVLSVEPPFVFVDSRATIRVRTSGPALTGGTNVYLVPTDECPVSAVALRLPGPVVLSATEVTARLPPPSSLGMDACPYVVTLVTPSGNVGISSDALSVTIVVDEPVRVDSVFPVSLFQGSDREVAVEGRYLNLSSAALHCSAPYSGDPTVSIIPAVDIVVNTALTSLTLTFDNVPAGLLCGVVVVSEDGTSARFDSVGTSSGSVNIIPPEPQSPLVIPRGAAAGAMARVDGQRFAWMVGGMVGLEGGQVEVESSSEVAPVGSDGTLLGWSLLRHDLPVPLAFASALAVGRWIYVIGGQSAVTAVDGTGGEDSASSTLYRAMVQSTAAVPSLTAVSFVVNSSTDSTGVPAGLVQYRVAARFAAGEVGFAAGTTEDDREGLPGDRFALQAPALAGISVRLNWTEVHGTAGPATSYVVYRADPGTGNAFRRIALVSATHYRDDGPATDAGVGVYRTPQLEGALTPWQVVTGASLLTARRKAGAALIPSGGSRFLSIFGGFGNTSDDALSDWELAAVEEETVRVESPSGSFEVSAQNVTTFSQGGSLDVARGGCSAAYTPANSVFVGSTPINKNLVWLGPGATKETAGGGSWQVDEFSVAQVGDLTLDTSLTWTRPDSGWSRYGGGASLYAGGPFVLGGMVSNGNVRKDGISAALNSDAPSYSNPNNFGVSLPTEVFFPSLLADSAFFLIAGGVNSGEGTADNATVDAVAAFYCCQ
jgi:hypothetical protein